MGFDNESILNPETVPGEYCCPLCRQLVYPNEAQQMLCGHLFCRQCVVYILGTTRCCPYDNHPVNEADPKVLREANPSLYESLCRIPVRCIYHKSGCAWQGQLADSTTHSASCPYGSSPVFCNRCGMQIMHRQIQDHVVSCTGTATQSQTQQQMVENSQSGRAASQQHVLGQGQASLGTQQIQQVSLGAQQIQQVSGHQVPQYVSGQEQPRLQSAAGQWNNQQQQRYQQPPEQYQQYQKHEQPQQIQQLQQHQQQVLTPPTQQFPQAPKPYHSNEPIPQQHQQQMHTYPYLQPQQSMPQGSQSQLPPEQLHLQQQHLHQQQSQPQHLPSSQALQHAQPAWEQQKHQQQMERFLDGNVQIAHVAAQTRVHDSNAFQHPGLPHSMQQQSTAAHSNLPSWQGHTLATSSGTRDPQGMQHIPNNQAYSALSNQYLHAPPARQASLHSTLNQHLSLPSNQAVSLSAQNSELANARPFPAAQRASDYLSAPSTYPTQRGSVLEQVAYAQQMNLHHQRGGQMRPDKQDGPAPEYHDTKRTVRKPLPAANERLPSVADKHQQKVNDRKVTDSFPERQGREAPPKDVLTSKAGEDENQHSTVPNKDKLHPERQETQHASEEDDSPKHQSPDASQEDEDEDEDEDNPHTLRKQRAHLSNEPSFSPEPMIHAALEPQDRIDSFPPAQMHNQSHHDSFRPFQSDPVSDMARMMHLRRTVYEYGRPPIQDGYSEQQAIRDDFFGTLKEERRPQMRGDFTNENSHLHASFAMPPPDGPARRSFMEVSRQAAIGGSRAERFNWTSFEPSRPTLDMLTSQDNGKRFDDNDKSWLFKSSELDAKDILQHSSFSKFEQPYTQSKIEDISPQRIRSDLFSRYPQNGPSLNMPSSMFPFSAELERKHGPARDTGSERFLSEIGLRQGQSSKLGAWSGTSMDMEPGPRFSGEFGTHVKLHPDGPSRYPRSPDLRIRPGPAEGGAPFGSQSDIDHHPGFPFDVESRPRVPLEMERRPGFPFEMEHQPRFPGDIESRPVLDLDPERRRPGLPMDIGGQPRRPNLYQDLMGRRPEGFGGSRSDFTGTISELLRRQSPGRDHGSLPFMRDPGHRLGLPSHLEGIAPRLPFHPGLEVNRDILRHEDPRFNIHRHALLHDPARLIHMGARAFPFSAPGPGMGHLPGRLMLEQLRPGLPPHLLPHGFVNGGPHHHFSQMTDSSEALDIGRKAAQTGNSGWCRICLVDCFSVDGLRKHSQSEEHQKKTLELVVSIKHENTKKQKHSTDDSRSMPENHKKARTSSAATDSPSSNPE